MLQYILRGVCRLNNRPYRVHHPLWNYYTIKMSMSGIINNAFEVNQQTSKCGSAMQFSTPNELSWQHNYLPRHKYIYWDSKLLAPVFCVAVRLSTNKDIVALPLKMALAALLAINMIL